MGKGHSVMNCQLRPRPPHRLQWPISTPGSRAAPGQHGGSKPHHLVPQRASHQAVTLPTLPVPTTAITSLQIGMGYAQPSPGLTKEGHATRQ